MVTRAALLLPEFFMISYYSCQLWKFWQLFFLAASDEAAQARVCCREELHFPIDGTHWALSCKENKLERYFQEYKRVLRSKILSMILKVYT